MTYTIAVAGLTKSFGAHLVLAGLDLRVQAGTVLALLGQNGAGKTTTVRILSTLLTPDAGTATVAGYDVVTDRDQVRRAISLTGQFAAVDEVLTGEENLRMMARLRHLGRQQARRRTEELLDRFDLRDAARRRVAEYSGGLRRRLDLAISLITDPPVVFLDEPTTGLDPRSRRAVWDAVVALRQQGTTILLTTQYLEEADLLADRIAVVDHGRVIAEGTAAQLKAAVGTETVELFFADEQRMLAAELALPRGQADRDRRSVAVPTDGTAQGVRVLLNDLAAAGVDAARVEVHRPTMDEVFLSLTERQSARTLEKTAR